MILLRWGNKEGVLSVIKTEHWKLKPKFEPQQAQVQKGEQDSESSRWLWWLVSAKVSLPLSNILQSCVSPQGRHERTSKYEENMIENNFISQIYKKI